MKRYYLFVSAFLIIVAGYYIFMQTQTNTLEVVDEKTVGAETLTGVVLNVDSSEIMLDGPTRITIEDNAGKQNTIAVPSMGINLCPAARRIANLENLAVGDLVTVRGLRDESQNIVPCADPADELVVTGKITDQVYGYEFSYRKGPDGYVSLADVGSQHADFVTGVNLFNAKEYEEYSKSLDAREGPPAMRLRIYQNPDKLQSSVWVMRNQNEVNANLMIGTEEEVVVGGANAVHFKTDGLFTTNVYVVAQGKNVYVLMGDYFDPNSAIHQDFLALVDSFTFIPTPSQSIQGRIDPRIACESALAYMTFANDRDANDFVEACVAGEHPEVIERYISNLGVDGAVI